MFPRLKSLIQTDKYGIKTRNKIFIHNKIGLHAEFSCWKETDREGIMSKYREKNIFLIFYLRVKMKTDKQTLLYNYRISNVLLGICG